MELKVWVEGIQRIVCGVTDKTTCQDVVYALAHATGKTGRFTLIERWRNNERLLAPQEHPLKVLHKWGDYTNDVQFILQRSALDGSSSKSTSALHHPLSPQLQRAKYSSSSGLAHHRGSNGGNKTPFEAVWKAPPTTSNGAPVTSANNNARLSPDSGRGSDKTGSDTSNSYSDKEQGSSLPAAVRYQQYTSQHHQLQQHHPSRYSGGPTFPPAYRPPPPASNFINNNHRNASPSEHHPPPYRAPPPPPPPGVRFRPPLPTSPTGMDSLSSSSGGGPLVRAPHYSPPPVHRTPHLSRHPSKSSLMGQPSKYNGAVGGVGPPSRTNGPNYGYSNNNYHYQQQQHNRRRPGNLELNDLYNLVSSQQSTLQSQQSDLKKYESEVNYLESQGLPLPSCATAGVSSVHTANSSTSSSTSSVDPLTPSLDVVLSEVRRLEEVAQRNDDELRSLNGPIDKTSSTNSGLLTPLPGSKEDVELRNEIQSLKQRLVGTDHELQKTNMTLKVLGEEMRTMSMEKNQQREQELMSEVEKLQEEIKTLQKSSEEGANISHSLSKEVKEIEEQIRNRKGEVEKLIKEMRDANMESLVISPPEESKQFLEGPPKPVGSQRKMLGSPRQLENAVPTSKNPHGVWV